MNVDEMLHHAGDFGRYQIVLMLVFSIINILSAFNYFSQTFISIIPNNFWCKSQYPIEILNENSVDVKLLSSFDFNSSHEYEYDKNTLQCYENIFNTNLTNTTYCQNGWNYQLDYGYSSIVDELNWVCKDDWKPVIGQSMYFIGSMLGTLCLGILADRIGRLHALVIANMFSLTGNIITMLFSNVVAFSVGRFVAGIATDCNFFMMYIIVMEYIAPKMRTFGLNLCIGIFYCIGCVSVPWIAVLAGTWRLFLVTISLPLLCTLSFYLIVPESAQWLLSRNQFDKAVACFKRIAAFNGKTIPDEAFEELRAYAKDNIDSSKQGSLIGLFKTPNLRRKTLILLFKSIVITLCYDAISRNINNLGISPFIIFSLTSVSILPACILLLCLQDVIGRKAMACIALLISGIFTSVSGIILATKNAGVTLTIILSLISRFGINVAYNSAAQYAVELIPTEVRGQGVAFVHLVGFGATFFSSQILYLAMFNKALPDLILGVLSVMGAFGCLFLPETHGKTLPITLKDGEMFGENEGIWDFACFSGKMPKHDSSSTLKDLSNTSAYESISDDNKY